MAAGALGTGACPGTRTTTVERPDVADGASTGPWFGDLGAPLQLQSSEAAALLARAVQLVAGAERAELPALSARLSDDKQPRIVFLSASDVQGPARVAFATGRGVIAALERATAQLRAGASGRGPPRWLALDVVGEVGPEQVIERDGTVDMIRGIHGLAFAPGTNVAFLGQEILGRRLVSRGLRLRLSRIGDTARARASDPQRERVWRAVFEQETWPVRVRAFSTESFFANTAAGAVEASMRGHPVERRVDDERLRVAITEGSEYLARATDADGRFVYAYLAKQSQVKDEYNMVRHAGTVFAMIQAYELSRDPVVLAAAERAIEFMYRHVVPYGESGQDMAALAFNGKIKLGGVALATFALATHVRVTGRRDHLPVAQKLCRYMVSQQRKDGSFVHQRRHPGDVELPFVSMYYPGEALLGLLAVYRIDGDPRWLNAAEKGARFLIETRDAGVPTDQLEHDHWLLYALERLHAERPHPVFLDHALRIAEAIIGAQKKSGLPTDQIGAYATNEPRATPIATRNEGLMAAYRMARTHGELDVAERILAAVELGNEVLVSMRITPMRALYLQQPVRALGGVTRSHDNFEIRIDYVQHSISAWLALLRARAERAPSARQLMRSVPVRSVTSCPRTSCAGTT